MSADKPRVLVVAPSLPYPPSWGFGRRVYELVRHLGARHSVSVLCYARSDESAGVQRLREMCAAVRVVPRAPGGRVLRRGSQLMSLASVASYHGRELRTSAMQAAINDTLAHQRFDLVQLESSQLCCFQFPTKAPVVLDEHNIESELLARLHEGERSVLRRLYNRAEHLKFRRLEQRWWHMVDACVVTSEREKRLLAARAPATPTMVVPNGVDPEQFTPSSAEPEPDTVVFTGLLTYRPNLDAARYLVDDVLPRLRRRRPQATLLLVGHGHPADLDRLRRPNVVVTGWVRDVRPHLAHGAAVAVPVRMGGGTRLKVVEALAMGKAVVSTTLGCEGIDVRDREHVLLANDPDRFAGELARLLADRNLGDRLGRAGRELVMTRYSWRAAGERLEQLYRDVGCRSPRHVGAPAATGEARRVG